MGKEIRSTRLLSKSSKNGTKRSGNVYTLIGVTGTLQKRIPPYQLNVPAFLLKGPLKFLKENENKYGSL